MANDEHFFNYASQNLYPGNPRIKFHQFDRIDLHTPRHQLQRFTARLKRENDDIMDEIAEIQDRLHRQNLSDAQQRSAKRDMISLARRYAHNKGVILEREKEMRTHQQDDDEEDRYMEFERQQRAALKNVTAEKSRAMFRDLPVELDDKILSYLPKPAQGPLNIRARPVGRGGKRKR